MTGRLLTVCFGTAANLAEITDTQQLSWSEFAAKLTAVPVETEDKASAGWYCAAEFDNGWRDNKTLVARHALTLDYDHIERSDIGVIQKAFQQYGYAIYTTWSHTAERPRIRVVLPLGRGVSAAEFCAVSRAIAAEAGIELASRESHVPAQCMFLPARKPDAEFKCSVHDGEFIDVDAVLGRYADWQDKSSWPHRADGDSVHHAATAEKPTDKAGIVGEFCRAFDVPAAIARFELPYSPTANPDRWTYTAGSRPEGAILYDDGQKLHSHHDTDPARGQHNSFDLVRLHRFQGLDAGMASGLPIGDLPSFRAMCGLAENAPECRAIRAGDELDVLPELVVSTADGVREALASSLARRICDVLRNPTVPRWLLNDHLEHGVIAVLAGPRGSYKSFLALDWACRIAQSVGAVYVISGEGGDFDRRANAWIKIHGGGDETIPLYVVERRIDLNTREGLETIRQDCLQLGIRPVLFVIDTYSKLSGGLDENDNTEVKAFIGRLDNGLKRASTGFDATVLLVAHTGHSDSGRPRGASALAADTDAEYIVSRGDDGTVSVTRERFKSSPELTPLTLRPQIVKLGYHDAAGQEITSLVLHPAEEIQVRQRPKKVTGAKHKALYESCAELLRTEPRSSNAIASILAERELKPEGRDCRKSNLIKDINTLIRLGHLFKTDNELLSLHPVRAIEVSPTEFEPELDL